MGQPRWVTPAGASDGFPSHSPTSGTRSYLLLHGGRECSTLFSSQTSPINSVTAAPNFSASLCGPLVFLKSTCSSAARLDCSLVNQRRQIPVNIRCEPILWVYPVTEIVSSLSGRQETTWI